MYCFIHKHFRLNILLQFIIFCYCKKLQWISKPAIFFLNHLTLNDQHGVWLARSGKCLHPKAPECVIITSELHAVHYCLLVCCLNSFGTLNFFFVCFCFWVQSVILVCIRNMLLWYFVSLMHTPIHWVSYRISYICFSWLFATV